MMANFWQDLRYGLRTLRKQPGFAIVAVISLALGIGGNAAIFSLINGTLIRPLPYSQPEQLVRVTEWYPKGGIAAMQAEGRTMDVAAFSTDSEFNLTGQGEAARVVGSQVSANLFALLGASTVLGRTFAVGEDRPARDAVVILSHALWRDKFGADPKIIDRPIIINGSARHVIGVMSSGFNFPSRRVQLWIPARFDPGDRGEYWEHGWMAVIARLRPGATLPQARSELRQLISQIITLFPFPTDTSWNAASTVVPLQTDLTADMRGKLLLLLCAVGCVLLIACTNMACLLLARGAARQRETAVRAALGAGRGRIVRQLLTESVVLALLGGGLGLIVATVSLSTLKSVLPMDNLLLDSVSIDWQGLVFLTVLAITTGLGFGLVPALSASKLNLAEAFKARGDQAAGSGSARLRSALIVVEVALAVVLVVSAGLLIKSLWRLTQTDPGFRPERIVTMRIYPQLTPQAQPWQEAYVAFYDDLVRRARETNGVSEAAVANTAPLSTEIPLLPVELEGHPFVPGRSSATLLWAGAVTPDYFHVLRIPLVAGRFFTESDTTKSPGVVLVSAETAGRFWPGDNPIGKHVRIVWEQQPRTVVGVVGNVRQFNLIGESPSYLSGALYMPYPQSVGLDRRLPAAITLIVRTTANAAEIASGIRRLVTSVSPDVTVSGVTTMEAEVVASTLSSRSLMWLFVAFGATALILATIGTYGVVSYSAAQRTYEMGVRVALGATSGSIFGLVIGQSLRLVFTGLVLGAAASLALAQFMTGFLYGVTATDPLTFVSVALLLIGTGIIAGYFPARRASRVDPMMALRS
jgi:putative ABC transport system permease protein